uniref:Nucleomorphin-like n=1 Tax=Nicotiana tabacum TaxID=4097 RepID=A0A1S3ZTX3_TOBAC|nr:nucleomorphin-like [Nicotiana tomentosiformis]XP_016467817.1 PREDICTED: nucleomorphin-like [Nicotiana tabacum]
MVYSKKGTANKNNVQQVEQIHRNNSNPFAALGNVNDDDGKIDGENLQLVKRNLVTNSLAQHYKSDVDHATAYKARLNTSNQDISSNNVVSFLEELVHPTRSHEAFSMMSSASKRLTTNEEKEDEEEYDSDKKYEEDEDEYVSKSWVDQVEEEECIEADSTDSYRAIIKENSSPTITQIVNTPRSKASTGKKKKLQQVQHAETVKLHDQQAPKSSNVLSSKRGVSPNAHVFVPSVQNQNAAMVLRNKDTVYPIDKALTTAMSTNKISHTARYNLTPTNILQALVSHDMDTLNLLGKKAVATTSNTIGMVDNSHDPGALVLPGYNHSDAFGMEAGQDFYEEGEEE